MYRSSVLCRNIHLSRHSTQTISARCVLAQDSAATPLPCRVRQNRGNGPSRAYLAGASIAYPGRPLLTKHERKGRDPRGNARTAELGRSTASPLAGVRFRPQQRGLPAVTNAASRTALKGSADCPSEVPIARIELYSFPVSMQGNLWLLLTLTLSLACVQCSSRRLPDMSPDRHRLSHRQFRAFLTAKSMAIDGPLVSFQRSESDGRCFRCHVPLCKSRTTVLAGRCVIS